MGQHSSLRASLLAALGAAGCSSPQAPPGEPALIVEIPPPPTPSTADAGAEAPPEPGPRPPRTGTGWVQDRDGTVHRASVTRCDAAIEQASCAGTEQYTSCKTDQDCTDHPHGKCVTGFGQVGTYCGCEYSCASDDDCGVGEVCVCKGAGNLSERHSVCAPAECRTDADCPEGPCGLSTYHDGCSEHVALACRTKDDVCHSDAECRVPGARAATCAARQPSRPGDDWQWACAVRSCVVGRPLVIEGAARTAAPARRADWSETPLLDPACLEEEERRSAAAHWAAQAAMEHASVASFARFSLQLLALGAPPDLVTEAHRAALDEVEHARVAYGVASRLAGRHIGPDLLPEAAAPLRVDLAAVVESLVEEGCVGETLGAAEGREIARRVTDGSLRAACAHIASDEERHAALAWRTLRWLLDTFGETARRPARQAFERAARRHGTDPEEGPCVLEELGILAARTLGALRREVLEEVIGPCRAQLGC